MLGAKEDMLKKAVDQAEQPGEEYVLKTQILKRWGLTKVLINFCWDLFWHRTADTRTLFLPKHAVERFRLEAQTELQAEEQISDGDVITAWIMRAVASSLPNPRSITAVHALNARLRLKSLIEAPGVFIQNVVVAAFVFVEHSMATGPLGPITRLNRQKISEQATEAQIIANMRELQKQPPGRVNAVSMICGNPDALLMPYTNWSRANLIHAVDFGSAVIREGDTGPTRLNPPGTIVYHHTAAMKPHPAARNFVMVLGHDHGGNRWITGILLRPAWEKIEHEISRM